MASQHLIKAAAAAPCNPALRRPKQEPESRWHQWVPVSLRAVTCGCWGLNPDPLEEQPVLLTTEPSLQPRVQIVVLFLSWFLRQGFSVEPWLSWNSLCRPGWPRTHLCLPSAEIKGMCSHHPADMLVFIDQFVRRELLMNHGLQVVSECGWDSRGCDLTFSQRFRFFLQWWGLNLGPCAH